MIVRLLEPVLVAGAHHDRGAVVTVAGSTGRSMLARGLAEEIASESDAPASQATLALDLSVLSLLAPAPALAPTVDPVLSDEVEETEEEAEPSEPEEARKPETESPGEPATVPEGESSSSPSRKRRRR